MGRKPAEVQLYRGYPIMIRIERSLELALKELARRERWSIAATARHLMHQALRQRGPDIRRILEGEDEHADPSTSPASSPASVVPAIE